MTKRKLGTVYVTGADGFIGSHLVESLLAQGLEVTALCIYNSNGHYGHLDKISRSKPSKLTLILGDVRDPFFLKETIKGHDTVFHLASLIAIPYSYQAPQSYFETNVLGTLNVAEACKEHKVSRLIHTSTSEVYGTAKFVPITEEHPLQGQSPYSASKIGADKVIESYFKSFELPTVTLRPFNTYGPRQSMRAVIPTVIAQLVAGKESIKLGALSPTRDFNYVQDTVNAFIAVAESTHKDILGETFNTGCGEEISIGDFVNLCCEVLGKRAEIICENERMRPEKSEVNRLLADNSKLKEFTDWTPQTSLRDGIKKVASWIEDSDYLEKADSYHR